MPPKADTSMLRMFKCPLLTGKGDFEPWWACMDDIFYSAGWQDIWDDAMEDIDVDDEDAVNADLNFNVKDINRQQAWGVVKSHMTAAEAKKFKSIGKGHVEGILRKLRHTYLKKNEIALDKLRNQLATAQLEDHVDLAAYITHVEWVANLMHEQSEQQSTGNKRFTLLKGLPTDYAPAVQSLRLPQQKDMTWDEIVAYLEDFVEANPSVLGAGPAGPSTTAAESTHATTTPVESAHPAASHEVCKNFSMTGSCVNGDRCGYRHVHQPRGKTSNGRGSDRPKCTHCDKPGHLEDVCFKKHGRPDWHKEKYPANGKKSTTGPDMKAAVYAVLSQLQLQQGSETESKREEHFAFGVEVISAAAYAMSQTQTQAADAVTMLDGGSTRHVTDESDDCIDIRACDIKVKVGGGTLTCSQQGTRVYHYLNSRGLPAECHLLDTLIIPGFGLKIVAEAPFLLKGCWISKCQGTATISSRRGAKILGCPINERGLAFLPPSLRMPAKPPAACPPRSPAPDRSTLPENFAKYGYSETTAMAAHDFSDFLGQCLKSPA